MCLPVSRPPVEFAPRSSNGDLTDSAKLVGIRRDERGLEYVKIRTGKDYLVFDGSGRDPGSWDTVQLAQVKKRHSLSCPAHYRLLFGPHLAHKRRVDRRSRRCAGARWAAPHDALAREPHVTSVRQAARLSERIHREEIRTVWDLEEPTIEIQPQGRALDMGPVRKRDDGKLEATLQFRSR